MGQARVSRTYDYSEGCEVELDGTRRPEAPPGSDRPGRKRNGGGDGAGPDPDGDVMVVDDTPATLELLVRTLEGAGYRVRTAQTAADAVLGAQEHPPALILMDVVLPDMDGFEACRLLKADERTRAVPILFLSALEDEASRLKGFEAGGLDYISKPFHREEMFARIRTHIELYRANREMERRNADLERVREALEKELRARKQIAEALRKSEEKFFRAFRSSPVMMALTSLQDDRFLEVNETFVRLTGYPREEAVGHASVDLDLWADPGWMRELARQLMDGRPVHDEEVRYRVKGGDLRTCLFSAERIDIEGWPCALAVLMDITDRKRLEERLVHLQRLESVGALAGGVAHEINNPLNVILNYADLITARLPPGDSMAEDARQIVVQGERIAGIVRNLLAFAQEERRPRRPTPVSDLVGPAVELVRAGLEHDGARIRVELPDGLPPLTCHRQQIQQVLVNLLTNARDALNERYPGNDDDKIVRIVAEHLPGMGRGVLRITVENHGAEIPPAVRRRLFEPFFTTKPRGIGTGLGLSISHGIVTEHHGTLTVEIVSGEWTRFHVEIPVDGGGDPGDGGTTPGTEGA